ncbi:MRN complex-interacting protein isoform X2 [Numida meleagris]|uniref:MRN complex-interacting protein isoform X2 n=1 Tax=Numida meleagris TaxID=8996 RepID=UPI000B3DCD0F|nr:MRN complex-interacting protein isoform X2 [Numida meleagris]
MAAPCWVLRCCSCRLFQAQQAKRSGKWSCSVCGQRQALQKGGRAEVSRWSKYLDKGSEDREEEEEEGSSERQQFCSQRKNAVEERRKKQKSFLYSDVQENSEENGAFQLAYQAKKHKKCSIAVPDEDDGDAVSADSLVPTVFESVVPQQTNQPPAACTKPSKWEKYLSCSDNRSENAVVATLSPQDGSGRLGPHSTTAVSMATRHSQQGRSALPPGTDFQFKKCIASSEQLALKLPGSMLPSISCSGEKDTLAKEPQSQVLQAGSGGFNTCSRPPAPALVRPNSHTASCERLFCTGDEFDDDF